MLDDPVAYKNMKIITLTLNPAVDVHCQADHFKPFHENLVTVTSRDSGGKGINISRALYANGINSMPIILLGKENEAEFRKGLAGQIPSPYLISCPGRIRENITIHSPEGETRVSFHGMKASDNVLERIRLYLDKIGISDSIITFTGSLPDGISPRDAEAFLVELASRGARLVIDSKSISLEALRRIRPWLIKPNAEELAQYLDINDPSLEQVAEAARSLQKAGITNVMISLGKDGALLCANEKLFRAQVPAIAAVSTIGAGDSTIAGFLAAYLTAGEGNSDADIRKLLHTAAAFGTAACLTEGTLAPQPDQIAAVYKDIKTEILEN